MEKEMEHDMETGVIWGYVLGLYRGLYTCCNSICAVRRPMQTSKTHRVLPNHLSGGFYSCITSLQKLSLPRSPSAILPRVALVVFFASAFREGFSAEFWDLLPQKGFEDYAWFSAHAHELPQAFREGLASADVPRPSAHTGNPRFRTKI